MVARAEILAARAYAVAAPLIALLLFGCTPLEPLPDPAADHPASPQAAETPRPARSPTLPAAFDEQAAEPGA